MSATRLAPLVVLLLALAARADGAYYSVTYPPSEKEGELKIGVTYTVWVPPGGKPLRGVIVHQHGCGSGACKGGETAAHDLHWQALARKHHCALLGPSYHQSDKQNCRLWCDPRNGSDRVFLRGLAELAKKSKRPELAEVPWCLWGHSGGGFWASLMQVIHPERIVAVWLRSGTAYGAWQKGEKAPGGVPRPAIPPAAYQVPVMCNPGLKEKGDKRFGGLWNDCLAMHKAYRGHGAPIGIAPDPRTGHECGDSRYLAIPFFDVCLKHRLPAGKSFRLKPMPMKGAYLADALGKKAAAAEEYKGKPEEATWLPGAAFAKAWEEYVAKGSVGDSTPPPAPFGVKVMRAGEKAVITWDAHADLESGLRGFIVLRDGKEAGQVPAKPLGRFGRPLFQTMSYHDTPEKGYPAMRFVDDRPGKEYRVIAVNSVGLKSK